MNTTPLEDIQRVAGCQTVELSGWEPNTNFVCKLKPIGMYTLLASGNIPNPLIPVVQDMFMGMKKTVENDLGGTENAKAFLAIAEAVMLEPSFSDLQKIGASLTDVQLLEIFFFATSGVRGLSAFRTIQRQRNQRTEQVLQAASQRDSAHR